MPEPTFNSSRRDFLGNTLKIGAGSMLLASSPQAGAGADILTPAAGGFKVVSMPAALPEFPARVFVEHDGTRLKPAEGRGARFTSDRAVVSLVPVSGGVAVRVTCPTGPLARIVLRWETTFPGDTLFLGDHWERGYGDLQWRFLQPERIMPWYFAAHHSASGRTFMAGVKTQPAALCFWTVDAAGISLWLDFRNGGGPSEPGDREIAAATIVSLATTAPEKPMTIDGGFAA